MREMGRCLSELGEEDFFGEFLVGRRRLGGRFWTGLTGCTGLEAEEELD